MNKKQAIEKLKDCIKNIKDNKGKNLSYCFISLSDARSDGHYFWDLYGIEVSKEKQDAKGKQSAQGGAQ